MNFWKQVARSAEAQSKSIDVANKAFAELVKQRSISRPKVKTPVTYNEFNPAPKGLSK